jgi:hypothetical protein
MHSQFSLHYDTHKVFTADFSAITHYHMLHIKSPHHTLRSHRQTSCILPGSTSLASATYDWRLTPLISHRHGPHRKQSSNSWNGVFTEALSGNELPNPAVSAAAAWRHCGASHSNHVIICCVTFFPLVQYDVFVHAQKSVFQACSRSWLHNLIPQV